MKRIYVVSTLFLCGCTTQTLPTPSETSAAMMEMVGTYDIYEDRNPIDWKVSQVSLKLQGDDLPVLTIYSSQKQATQLLVKATRCFGRLAQGKKTIYIACRFPSRGGEASLLIYAAPEGVKIPDNNWARADFISKGGYAISYGIGSRSDLKMLANKQ
ncbi:hypothetical protein GEV47_03840 [Glaciimonas sp. GS1]|uniref:Lipoprotein n=2 Tax=Glaciimonas soli TaxID=2590999 RepID=A0A843YPB0_9BURK|nr:hypothetical protein [Glaciimonas soli]